MGTGTGSTSSCARAATRSRPARARSCATSSPSACSDSRGADSGLQLHPRTERPAPRGALLPRSESLTVDGAARRARLGRNPPVGRLLVPRRGRAVRGARPGALRRPVRAQRDRGAARRRRLVDRDRRLRAASRAGDARSHHRHASRRRERRDARHRRRDARPRPARTQRHRPGPGEMGRRPAPTARRLCARGGRNRLEGDGDGARLRRRARAVRQEDRLLSSDLPLACRRLRRRRALPLPRVLGGVVGRRERRAGRHVGRRGEVAGDGSRRARMREVDPGARRHRLHLGVAAAPLLQEGALPRRRPRVRARASRGDRRIPAVLVTGASTGIGRATAEYLRDRGWDVHASVRNAGDAPVGTSELVFDVADAGAIAAAVVQIDKLDALVANAGIAIAAPLEFLPPEELTRQLDVNVVGQLRVLQAFLPKLGRPRGRIVLMGSIGGRSALPFLGAYAMSKFALEAMADALRLELAPFRVHLAILEPGTIATAIWTKPQRAVDDFPPDAAQLYGERVEKFRRLAASRASNAVPAAEVAKAVEHALTAAKPKTRYVVGPDAKRRAAVQRLPDRWRDSLLSRFLFGSWKAREESTSSL